MKNIINPMKNIRNSISYSIDGLVRDSISNSISISVGFFSWNSVWLSISIPVRHSTNDIKYKI